MIGGNCAALVVICCACWHQPISPVNATFPLMALTRQLSYGRSTSLPVNLVGTSFSSKYIDQCNHYAITPFFVPSLHWPFSFTSNVFMSMLTRLSQCIAQLIKLTQKKCNSRLPNTKSANARSCEMLSKSALFSGLVWMRREAVRTN